MRTWSGLETKLIGGLPTQHGMASPVFLALGSSSPSKLIRFSTSSSLASYDFHSKWSSEKSSICYRVYNFLSRLTWSGTLASESLNSLGFGAAAGRPAAGFKL